MLFWLMGDLSYARHPLMGITVLLAGLLPALALARPLNLLARGDLAAAALGEHPARLRLAVYFLASLLTAAAVTLAGSVGFVGLVVPHTLRLVSSRLWVDVTQRFEVAAGETVRPELRLPGRATLIVQAFPANCKVYLRRQSGGSWQYLDETPLSREIAAGDYRVKVEFKPTGEEKVLDITLTPGRNPPVRVSFGGGAS